MMPNAAMSKTEDSGGLTSLRAELERRTRVEEQLTDTIAVQTAREAASEELFQLLVDSVRDYAIFMLDANGLVATWNAGAERLKGYAGSEIIGRHFSTFYPAEDVAAGKCEMELEVATREGRFAEEGWRIRKDGSRFWAHVVVSSARTKSGELVGFARVTRDLTERQRADEQRIAAEERFRRLVESVVDYAIFVLDSTGHIATWNTGAERLKGYRAEEAIGMHFSRFYPREDVAAGKCEMELEVATRVGRFEEEGWRVRKDGSQFWASVVIGAIRNPNGDLAGFSKVTRDLTERKRTEDERAARLAAEQANRIKDEFLAMLGHELRNPLAPIVTALDLIAMRGETAAAKEHKVIERQVKHMMHLVDDLLDVSRISSGKIELRKRHLDMRDVISKAVEVASPLFEQKRHKLTIDVPATALVVSGDEARLTQVVANLLTNAAKYTASAGRVTVSARDTDEKVTIEVTDSGSGIGAELLPRIFDVFVQGYQTSERAGGGLGLGLRLVKSLVELHGGSVAAHSAGLGTGSRFTVVLPRPGPSLVEDAAAPVRPARKAPGSAKILVVDDNEDARLLLGELLGSVGFEVKHAADGPEALEVLKTFAPTVAVLDIGLPVMDGYDLAIRMRQQLGAATPALIAVTGYGQQTDRRRSEVAGFARHLVKPVDLHQLLDAIAEVTRPR